MDCNGLDKTWQFQADSVQIPATKKTENSLVLSKVSQKKTKKNCKLVTSWCFETCFFNVYPDSNRR